jgi:sigma-B regulation protein RsbU (phosphoserine phosphatase)
MTDDRWQQATGSVSAQLAPSALDLAVMIDDVGAAAPNEGVVIQRSTGEIMWCNAVACRLLQLSADQLVGRRWPEFDPPPLRNDGTLVPTDTLPWIETLRTGVSITNSVIGLRRVNGTTVWLSVDSKLAMDVDEPVVITLLLDVTAEFNRRAELDEAMRQIAESMFQTQLPSSGRVEFASKTRASGSSNSVGRDFCGVHQLGEGRYSFFLGNIRSQRAEEACANSFVRHTLHSAGTLLHDPHEVLYHLHDAIEWEWPETAIQAIFGYLDIDSTTESADIRVACGGLPMPTIITDAGIGRLGRDDWTFDDVPDRDRFTNSIKMRAGNRLVLCTARRFLERAVESRCRVHQTPLRAGAPIGELVDTAHDIAAVPERDDDRDCDASVLVIAFD